MGKNLKIKSAEEFEKLLCFLADELFRAKVHFTILSDIRRSGSKYKDEIGFSPVFWQFTFQAHANACVMRVLRIYDQHPSGFHLLRLLETVKDNDWLFAKTAFLARLKNNEDAERLFQGGPDKQVLEDDIHFVSDANPRIKLIKKWRDEVMFHKDPRHLLSGRSFETDNPLPLTEISELIEAAAKLVNRYSAHFNSVHYGNDTKQWSDVDFVLEALTHHPDVVELRQDEKLYGENKDNS